jgi:hypothetical protein
MISLNMQNVISSDVTSTFFIEMRDAFFAKIPHLSSNAKMCSSQPIAVRRGCRPPAVKAAIRPLEAARRPSRLSSARAAVRPGRHPSEAVVRPPEAAVAGVGSSRSTANWVRPQRDPQRVAELRPPVHGHPRVHLGRLVERSARRRGSGMPSTEVAVCRGCRPPPPTRSPLSIAPKSLQRDGSAAARMALSAAAETSTAAAAMSASQGQLRRPPSGPQLAPSAHRGGRCCHGAPSMHLRMD